MLSSSGAYLRTKMPFLISHPRSPAISDKVARPCRQKRAPLFFLRACPRLFCIMHRVVKIACSVSDETLDASCAQAAKDAAARGLPFAESCEYNKVCRLFLGCLSSLLPSAHVPIATALRAVLSPNAPPITALEIGSGTAQASHLPRGQCLALIFSPTARASFARRILR